MLSESNSYKYEINRINSKSKTNPGEIAISEYSWNNTMLLISLFINKLVDPKDEETTNESNRFINKFKESANVYKTTILNPESQLFITNREYALVNDFKVFVESLVKKNLNKQIFFNINPVFIDTLLTEINFFVFKLFVNISYGNLYKQ